jgi:hypothetical protein
MFATFLTNQEVIASHPNETPIHIISRYMIANPIMHHPNCIFHLRSEGRRMRYTMDEIAQSCI